MKVTLSFKKCTLVFSQIFNLGGLMKQIGIHDRIAARLDKLLGIEKYRTLRKQLVKEEELDEISVDHFMALSISIICRDKVLLELFAEQCEIYGCCPKLFDSERNLHLETMPSEVMEYLRSIYEKLNYYIANGYFNSVRQ